MKFCLIAILAALSATNAMATDVGDLYPDAATGASRVRAEYEAVANAFEHGQKDAAQVFAVLNPGTLTCAYYMGNFRRKDDVTLEISQGRLGRATRMITILGTKTQVLNPRYTSEGPWAQAQVEKVKYTVELRLGTGEAEGSLLASVRASDGDINFDRNQYLVCN